MYLGEAMGSFANGVQNGYAFVDNAISKKQDREIQQQQAKQQADLRAEQIKQAQMKSGWMTELDDANNPQAQLNKVQQESQQAIAEVKKQSQKMNGMNMDMDINGLSAQPTIKERDEYLQSVNAKIKSNPQAYSALGLKGSLEVLNTSSSKDRNWMVTHLENRGINPKDLDLDITDPADKDIWEEVLNKAMDIYPVVKEGENRVDMNELGIGSGSLNKANPTVRKQIEANMQIREDELYNLVQEKRVGKDAVDANFNNATNDVTPKLDIEIDEEATKALATDDASVTAMQEQPSVTPIQGDFIAKDVGDFKAKTIQERYDSVGDQAKSFYKDFTAWAGEKGIDVAMAEGARDQARQEELYAQGRTKPGPIVTWTKNSKHKDGNAMDVVAGDYQNAEANTTVAKAMRQFAKENPQYGASFLSIAKDPNHVQFDGAKEQAVPSTKSNISQDPKQAMQDVAKEAKSTGKPISQDRMDFLYSALGMTNPNKTGAITASSKMKDTQFLVDNGMSKDDAINTVYGSNAKPSRKQAGAIAANEANIAMDAKVAKGYTMTDADTQRYDLNTQIVEGVKFTAHQDNLNSDTARRNQGRMASDEALSTLAGKDVDKDIKTNSIRKLDEAQSKLRQVDPKAHKAEADTIKSMQGTQISMNSLADTMNKIEGGELKDIDTGIVANALSAGAKLLDEPSKKKMDSLFGTDWRKTSEANIKKDVAVGLLQAEFIKSISGATVTNEERKILLDTITGGDWADETTLKIALKEFYKVQGAKQNDRATTLKEGVSPYDGYRYNQIRAINSLNEEKGSTVSKPTSPSGTSSVTKSLEGW